MFGTVTPTSPVGETYMQAVGGTQLPEPSQTGMGMLQDVAERAVSKAFEIGGVPLGATGSFSELIQAQIQSQMEMQTTSLVSNIERSKHESKMAAIRNIRLG